MTKPTFLGIGVPRAGTTWLHEHINGHPNGFTPRLFKEVSYYQRYYDKGPDWYARFFEDADPQVHMAIGEITPHYLFEPAAIDRIEADGIEKLIVILREPVYRLWSTYLLWRGFNGFRGSFADFIDSHPDIVGWGEYAAHLRPWKDRFGDGLLVLVFEEMMANPQRRDERLGHHLGIDPAGFPDVLDSSAVNASSMPRFPRANHQLMRLNYWMVGHGHAKTAHRLKSLARNRKPAQRATATTLPSFDSVRPEIVDGLRDRFRQSFDELQPMVDVDLNQWWDPSR